MNPILGAGVRQNTKLGLLGGFENRLSSLKFSFLFSSFFGEGVRYFRSGRGCVKSLAGPSRHDRHDCISH